MERNRKSLLAGLAGGAGAAMCVALLMGQGGAQPPGQQRGGDFFVTGEGTHAYLWQREGTSLRYVSQADTTRPPRHDPARPADPDRKPTDPPK